MPKLPPTDPMISRIPKTVQEMHLEFGSDWIRNQIEYLPKDSFSVAMFLDENTKFHKAVFSDTFSV